MDGINVRISECMKSMNIKKTEFAARINVSQAFVSQLTSGTSRPSDRTISDICREFGINEIWLRTGSGEMFQPLTRRDRIASFVGHALQDEPDSFRLKLIDALAVLTPEDWAVLAKMAPRVESEWKSEKDQADAQSSQEESISEND